ncbi:NAD(P)-dependent oxidoreductase [Amycolatopsis saalfeldensis]|uniref:Putative NADH-flavin reductase n=1 Tax=Amycolatopsis saalfeldensis TaxID=394193 RepID=A0A1H8YQ96_9PSEU|nr:NAD(P)-binding oxidoreductase [Amycolatopsis saalfeldensis]SEP54356.1 Putative NADH-flavin reductase [Amycolatopsis saalfeldensis]
MKLVLVAATGRIGRLALDQAVAAGHDVTAVARRPDGLPVPVVAVDFTRPDLDALADAMAGADAVVSALGPRSRSEDGIVSTGTRALTTAMATAGVRRLVAVSVAGIAMREGEDRDPGAGWFTRNVLGRLAQARLGTHYADIATTHDLLRRNDLDWTTIGCPLLTDRPATGDYRVAYDHPVRGGWRISRADAAACLLATITRPDTFRRNLAIAH